MLGMAIIGYLAIPKPPLLKGATYGAVVTDRAGHLLRISTAADQRYRLYTPLEQISPDVTTATLLYEDRYFRLHLGFNPVALLRAAWSTFGKRTRPMGASTLTMQVVRLRDGLNTRRISGKLTQIARAIQVERHYSKDEILEAYMNMAPYGGNVEGIEAAARIYFDKPAAELSLAESLSLAVVAQNPVGRNPQSVVGRRALLDARDRLSGQWLARYRVTAGELAALQLPIAVRTTRELPFAAPHIVERTLRASSAMQNRLTVDRRLQNAVVEAISQYVASASHRGITNASAMIVDSRNLEVLASVGSADFFNSYIAGQVDGTYAQRSPGSTLKPFLYGLALDEGLIHPATLLLDAPSRYAAYAPENFDRGFAGPISATEALVYSRNVPAVTLLNDLGLDRFHDLLTRGGVTDLKPADHYGLAAVLGGNEIRMRELVALYAMLANRGLYRPLRNTLDGQHPAPVRLLSPEASFLVLEMLSNNPRPGRLALTGTQSGLPWKTGTSYGFRDAWSVGLVGPYVVAVWVGNFDGSSNPAFVGREAAAPLFFALADRLRGLQADAEDRYPVRREKLNLRRVALCAVTGTLPSRLCPRLHDGWFIPGVSPIAVSNVFREVYIDKQTGLRRCHYLPEKTDKRVYEFWPADIVTLWRAAGLAPKQPPAWGETCSYHPSRLRTTGPVITSPTATVNYIARSSDATITLDASADAEVKSLFWFADERFVGQTQPGQPIQWTAPVGVYELNVVDDLGRSDARLLRIASAH